MAGLKSAARGAPASSKLNNINKNAKTKATAANTNKKHLTASSATTTTTTKKTQQQSSKPAGPSSIPEAKKEGESKSDATTTTSATPYSRAISRLGAIHPVLAGIAHRNHNQHRRAAWWRYLRMLRRHCGKFAEELAAADVAAEEEVARVVKAAKAKTKKRRREMLISGEKSIDADDDDEIGLGSGTEVGKSATKYAVWLRDILVPKCYFAFSQLTADNQFATLGVVLLGVLASVQAACNDLAPSPSSPSLGLDSSSLNLVPGTSGTSLAAPNPSADGSSAVSVAAHATVFRPGIPATVDERSIGRAISREALERAEKEKNLLLSQSSKDASTIPPNVADSDNSSVPDNNTLSKKKDKASKPCKTKPKTEREVQLEIERHRTAPPQAEKDAEGIIRPSKRLKTTSESIIPKPSSKTSRSNQGNDDDNNSNKSKDTRDEKSAAAMKGKKEKEKKDETTTKKKKKVKKGSKSKGGGGDEFDDLFKDLF